MGAGRSGSTTLGIALGNCADVCFAGELDNWLVRAGAPQLGDPERERFWRGVREQLDDPGGASSMFGNDAQRAIERSLSLLRVHLWPTRYRLRRRYRAVSEDLYGAVARTAGVTHVADSSHYPLRARELQRVPGIELSLVYLVRDPQGVVASFNRSDVEEYKKSTLHTNVYLWVTHLLSVLVFLRHPRRRRLLVRYEDFIADPDGVLRQILECAGAPAAELPDFAALEVGIPLQGNRVSRSQRVSLKGGVDPLRSRSRATALIQAPVMALIATLRPRATVARSARS